MNTKKKWRVKASVWGSCRQYAAEVFARGGKVAYPVIVAEYNRCGSVTNTAATLGVSKGTVSKVLAKCHYALGVDGKMAWVHPETPPPPTPIKDLPPPDYSNIAVNLTALGILFAIAIATWRAFL